MIFTNMKLSDLCVEISYGYTASATENNTGCKFLRITDIQGGYVDWDKVPFCEIESKDITKYQLIEGDIVIARTGNSTGENFIFQGKNNAVFASYLIRYRVNKEIANPYYIWLNLRSSNWWGFVSGAKSGSAQAGANAKILGTFEIPIPDLQTQNKIADFFQHINNKIQLNTQINQTLEQIAQALFKSWFVDFDPVRAKVQALSNGLSLEQAELAAMQAISGKTPEELTALSQTQPERYAELAETAKAFPCEMVEVDGVEIPKGWEVKRIDEVIQKIPVGKKYSSKIAFSEGLVPILDQGRSGVIGYHNDKPGVKASIEDPIIVFANHTCYMRLISYDFSAIQNVFAFKGKECNLYWLYLATLGKQEFVEYKGHFPDFLIKEIIVPPEELTELFGKYVKESFSKIFINDRENSNLAKIRDLLLPKLLNGGIQNE